MRSDDLKTLPEVAKEIGVTERRADYAARLYNVECTRRVGIIRLYNLDAAKQIRAAIIRVSSARREAVNA